MSFAGRAAFVTGGGAGIGRATALELASKGAAVAVFDLREGPAAETVELVRRLGGDALALTGDVGISDHVRHSVEAAVSAYGGLDIVIANAGIEVLGTILETDESAWERVIATNLTGVFLTVRHALPHLLARGRGSIVTTASDAGVAGAQGYFAYCATKHGVIGMTRCLALDFGPHGIRANAVCPSFVETDMLERIFDETPDERPAWRASVPLQRFCRPEEVAKAICHLASDEASYTNGHIYRIDGGSTAGYFLADSGT